MNNDLIVSMNYASTRNYQKEKCLSCNQQLPETAFFVMDQRKNIYEIYCNKKCKELSS